MISFFPLTIQAVFGIVGKDCQDVNGFLTKYAQSCSAFAALSTLNLYFHKGEHENKSRFLITHIDIGMFLFSGYPKPIAFM